eukprot:6194329-Pleurochrysis_carterae.AAC.1
MAGYLFCSERWQQIRAEKALCEFVCPGKSEAKNASMQCEKGRIEDDVTRMHLFWDSASFFLSGNNHQACCRVSIEREYAVSSDTCERKFEAEG